MSWLCMWHGEDVKRGKKYPMTFLDMTDETGLTEVQTASDEGKDEEVEKENLELAKCEEKIAKWESANEERHHRKYGTGFAPFR